MSHPNRDVQLLGNIITVDDDKILHLQDVTINGSFLDRAEVRLLFRDAQGNMILYGGMLKMKQFVLRDEEVIE